MLDFTERQHNILLALNKNKHAELRELAAVVGVSISTVHFELKKINRMVRADHRHQIVTAAKAKGWRENPQEIEDDPTPAMPDETPEQMMERLIGDSIPAGPLRKVRLQERMIAHAAANFRQALELTEEDKMPTPHLKKRIDDLKKSLQKIQVAVNGATVALDDARCYE